MELYKSALMAEKKAANNFCGGTNVTMNNADY
jgi:hypothetical protein